MSSKTKIIVLRMKEIIYTGIFILLGILLMALLFVMFHEKEPSVQSSSDSIYIPGIYTSALVLGSQQVNVEVTVDRDQISSITLQPLSDSVATMYPLMQPALDDLAAQICEGQTLENLSYAQETRYTSEALIQSIGDALEKAKID